LINLNQTSIIKIKTETNNATGIQLKKHRINIPLITRRPATQHPKINYDISQCIS